MANGPSLLLPFKHAKLVRRRGATVLMMVALSIELPRDGRKADLLGPVDDIEGRDEVKLTSLPRIPEKDHGAIVVLALA
jgi:hypothetical protein